MEAYDKLMDKIGDAIINWHDPGGNFRGNRDSWWLCDFRSAITLVLAYLAFVLVGARYMKDRPAVNTTPFKFIFNLGQIFICAYMTVEAALLAFRNGYAIIPSSNDDFSKNDEALSNLLWIYYITKIWDFSDTVLIIAGKKWSQLSFLHVYHHTGTFLLCWLIVNVLYGGFVYLTILLNAWIHTIMYSYYFVALHAAKDPTTGKPRPIWWKSSLTMLQLIQFTMLMAQSSYIIAFSDGEKLSVRTVQLYFLFVVSLFVLFAQFYSNAYIKQRQSNE